MNTLHNLNVDLLPYDRVKYFDIYICGEYFEKEEGEEVWTKRYLKRAPDIFLGREVLNLYRQRKLVRVIKNTEGFYYEKIGKKKIVKYVPEILSIDDMYHILNVKRGGKRKGAGRNPTSLNGKVMRVPNFLNDTLKVLFKIILNVVHYQGIKRCGHSEYKKVDIPLKDLVDLKENLETWQRWVDDEIQLIADKEKKETKDKV